MLIALYHNQSINTMSIIKSCVIAIGMLQQDSQILQQDSHQLKLTHNIEIHNTIEKTDPIVYIDFLQRMI
jgi:hypothetical protein